MIININISINKERKPYSWQTWKNGKVIKLEIANVLTYYDVNIKNLEKISVFDVTENLGNIYFDNDDTFYQNLEALIESHDKIKEIHENIKNRIVEMYFDKIETDEIFFII